MQDSCEIKGGRVLFRTHQVGLVGVVRKEAPSFRFNYLSLLRSKRGCYSSNYSLLFQHANFFSFYSKKLNYFMRPVKDLFMLGILCTTCIKMVELLPFNCLKLDCVH